MYLNAVHTLEYSRHAHMESETFFWRKFTCWSWIKKPQYLWQLVTYRRVSTDYHYRTKGYKTSLSMLQVKSCLTSVKFHNINNTVILIKEDVQLSLPAWYRAIPVVKALWGQNIFLKNYEWKCKTGSVAIHTAAHWNRCMISGWG